MPHLANSRLRASRPFSASLSASAISAPLTLQLHIRYLTEEKLSRSNPLSAKKFFHEVFHTTKFFVLVCRLFYLLKFSFAQASAPDVREAFCTN
jgi:hypothetical protein